MFRMFDLPEIRQRSAARPHQTDAVNTWPNPAVPDLARKLAGPHVHVYGPNRLTVPELERYIRRGCSCSVCEFARAEIRAGQKLATGVRASSGR